MTVDFDASQYRDGYRAALEELVAAKIAGRDVIRPQQPAAGPDSSRSLAEVLKASLAAVQQGDDTGPPHGGRKRRPQRKASA
jgi:DNA end-binding protein Ku